MAVPFFPNHGVSGQYVCGADGVMHPAVAATEPEGKQPVKPAKPAKETDK